MKHFVCPATAPDVQCHAADLAIVAKAFGVRQDELLPAGLGGVVSRLADTLGLSRCVVIPKATVAASAKCPRAPRSDDELHQ